MRSLHNSAAAANALLDGSSVSSTQSRLSAEQSCALCTEVLARLLHCWTAAAHLLHQAGCQQGSRCGGSPCIAGVRQPICGTKHLVSRAVITSLEYISISTAPSSLTAVALLDCSSKVTAPSSQAAIALPLLFWTTAANLRHQAAC